MNFPFIDLASQYEAYKDEINSAIFDVIQTQSFIGGKQLENFESNLAQYVGVSEAIGCSSGTSAILLALMALGIGEGDEVIVPSFTFIATAEMVSLLKAKPVFADINLIDYNIDINSIQELITNKTKAVIAVSMFGQMPNLDELEKLCSKHNIALIEDGAQSFGAMQHSKKSCSIAKISCTSFFPSKPLGAYGDAGAIFSNDSEIAKMIRIYLNHGQIERYKHKLIGFNGRLDTIQAAILNVKLKHIDIELQKRQEIAEIYNKNLQNVIIPQIKEGFNSVYAQYSIRVKNRAEVIKHLTSLGIPTAIHYPLGLHKQEAFISKDTKILPNTELLCEEILSLPMSAFLKEEHQMQVIEAVNKCAIS